jgi:two-component system CheB/CheR fusion protein
VNNFPNTAFRILVVDDNKDAADTMGTLLEQAGYLVETCCDSQAALTAAARFAPDACVLDIRMPGLDGYELARKLRESKPDRPPVLAAVTGYDDYTHLSKAADAGFDLHFTKPAHAADVAEQLSDCFRRGSELSAGPDS